MEIDNPLPALLLVMCGATAYAGFHHLTIGLRRPYNRTHLLFATLCLTLAATGALAAAMFTATDAGRFVAYLRVNLGLAASFSLLLFAFVLSYVNQWSGRLLAMLGAILLVACIANFLYPFTLQYVSLPTLETIVMPWGERLKIPSASNNPAFALAVVPYMGVLTYSFWVLIRFYRQTRNRSALGLMLAIGFFVAAVVQGLLVRAGVIDGIPLGSFAFVTIPLVMSAALGYEMRMNDRRLREILDHVPALVYMKDLEGRYLMANKYWLQTLSQSPKEAIIGKTDFDLFAYDLAERYCANDRQVIAGNRAMEFEEANGSGGELRTFYSIKFPVVDAKGTPIAVCGISTDITERKQVEAELGRYRLHLEELVAEKTDALQKRNDEFEKARNQLLQSEKLAALGGLVAGVAHELNTPMGNALTTASALQSQVKLFTQELGNAGLRRSQLDSFVAHCLEAADLIERSISKAAALVSSFKRIAVDQTGESRCKFGLPDLVTETLLTISPTLRQSQARISLDIPQELVLDSFPGAIEQVLTNLVQNAAIHAQDGARPLLIAIHARLTQETGEPRLQLVISDNGRGMDADTLKRAFDPYFTTRFGQGGSGLGLYIVHNLVTGTLGGTISLESALDKGAVFTVFVPLIAPQAKNEIHER
jgi:PAS domain S-box-containing protein